MILNKGASWLSYTPLFKIRELWTVIRITSAVIRITLQVGWDEWLTVKRDGSPVVRPAIVDRPSTPDTRWCATARAAPARISDVFQHSFEAGSFRICANLRS